MNRAAGAIVVTVMLVLPLIVACASARLAPDPSDALWAAAQWPGTTASDLDAGYSVYRRRCAGCHHLPLPSAHDPEKWDRALRAMTPKARLTPAEHDLVLHYILSVQAREEASAMQSDPAGAR